jgi:PAS domain S-box-containing protein
MERIIEMVSKLQKPKHLNPPSAAGNSGSPSKKVLASGLASGIIATGPLDRRSLIFALCGALAFFSLAILCVTMSRFNAALASVWIPHASIIALLLLGQLRNEVPVYGGVFIAGIGANLFMGHDFGLASLFAVSNLIEIAAVTSLTRRVCTTVPKMTDLSHLGHFLFYGGFVGPALSATVTGLFSGAGIGAIMSAASSWFLTHSMGTILTVPAVLLIAETLRNGPVLTNLQLGERSALMIGGLFAGVLVFNEQSYPLLFLIPPITLLIAFRLGGLGTAIYVPGIAFVASWMTYSGMGPIVQYTPSSVGRMYVIQAFIAANFLTGLPIAAILAGRHRLTQDLAEGRSELALLAENVTDAVRSIDTRGVCTYASPSVREVLGREPCNMVGQLVTEHTHEDASDRIASVFKRLIDGEVDRERVTYRRLLDADNGTPVFIEANCAIASSPETGELSGVVVSARDVTERVELELLLTRARRQAEHAARAKSEFLANMSHEIRTPMNGVLGFADRMLQGDLDDVNRRHTQMIVQSGRSMMLLLNDILDLSKIEAGQITIDHAPLDLYATIAECAALHRPMAEQRGLDLIFRTPCEDGSACGRDPNLCASDNPHPWVVTDGLRLRQVLLNLIANAVKFTEHGSVEISCQMDEGEFCILVSDTGIGISAARIDTIFAPFTQGENDTARRFGGTGLGLTISRQLTELLGGVIEVESEPGAGSQFRITLPAVIAEPEASVPAAIKRIEPADLPQSARILLVEDHDVNRLLGSEMLERCGQSVAIAHDGNEAIAMVIDSMMRDKPYDLVFMDIQMPGCDGYAATRAIRAEGIGPDVMPIVALTANAFPEDIAAAREAGMQAHLAKPLVFADLARSLQRWLPTRIIEAGDIADGGAEDRDGSLTRDSDFDSEFDDEAVPSSNAENAAIDDLSTLPIERGADRRSDGDRRVINDHVVPVMDTPQGGTSQNSRLSTLPSGHSPALVHRWNERRADAIEAVRNALESGVLCENRASQHSTDELARLVHKLAGTAAIFGEPELGDQAAVFERALRQDLPGEVREALAFELLSVADDPADTLASTGT